MAHALKIIPKGIRMGKRVQALNRLKNDKQNIQQKIDTAAKLHEKLKFEKNEHDSHLNSLNIMV